MAPPQGAEKLLAGRVQHLVDDLLAGRELVRVHDKDAIHDTRVATRRLRSLFRTFESSFSDGALVGVGPELSWLGCQLGPARDAEVLVDRIRLAAPQMPAAPELSTALGRLVDEIGERARSSAERIAKALSSARFEHLTQQLRAIGENPPLAGGANRTSALRRALGERIARADALAGDAARLEGEEHELALHEVRKAAKHVRYAAEVLAPLEPTAARRCVRAYANVQEVLGAYHDALVAKHFALERLSDAIEDRSTAFVCGVIYRFESDQAEQFEAGFEPAWERAQRRGARELQR